MVKNNMLCGATQGTTHHMLISCPTGKKKNKQNVGIKLTVFFFLSQNVEAGRPVNAFRLSVNIIIYTLNDHSSITNPQKVSQLNYQ